MPVPKRRRRRTPRRIRWEKEIELESSDSDAVSIELESSDDEMVEMESDDDEYDWDDDEDDEKNFDTVDDDDDPVVSPAVSPAAGPTPSSAATPGSTPGATSPAAAPTPSSATTPGGVPPPSSTASTPAPSNPSVPTNPIQQDAGTNTTPTSPATPQRPLVQVIITTNNGDCNDDDTDFDVGGAAVWVKGAGRNMIKNFIRMALIVAIAAFGYEYMKIPVRWVREQISPLLLGLIPGATTVSSWTPDFVSGWIKSTWETLMKHTVDPILSAAASRFIAGRIVDMVMGYFERRGASEPSKLDHTDLESALREIFDEVVSELKLVQFNHIKPSRDPTQASAYSPSVFDNVSYTLPDVNFDIMNVRGPTDLTEYAVSITINGASPRELYLRNKFNLPLPAWRNDGTHIRIPNDMHAHLINKLHYGLSLEEPESNDSAIDSDKCMAIIAPIYNRTFPPDTYEVLSLPTETASTHALKTLEAIVPHNNPYIKPAMERAASKRSLWTMASRIAHHYEKTPNHPDVMEVNEAMIKLGDWEGLLKEVDMSYEALLSFNGNTKVVHPYAGFQASALIVQIPALLAILRAIFFSYACRLLDIDLETPELISNIDTDTAIAYMTKLDADAIKMYKDKKRAFIEAINWAIDVIPQDQLIGFTSKALAEGAMSSQMATVFGAIAGTKLAITVVEVGMFAFGATAKVTNAMGPSVPLTQEANQYIHQKIDGAAPYAITERFFESDSKEALTGEQLIKFVAAIDEIGTIKADGSLVRLMYKRDATIQSIRDNYPDLAAEFAKTKGMFLTLEEAQKLRVKQVEKTPVPKTRDEANNMYGDRIRDITGYPPQTLLPRSEDPITPDELRLYEKAMAELEKAALYKDPFGMVQSRSKWRGTINDFQPKLGDIIFKDGPNQTVFPTEFELRFLTDLHTGDIFDTMQTDKDIANKFKEILEKSPQAEEWERLLRQKTPGPTPWTEQWSVNPQDSIHDGPRSAIRTGGGGGGGGGLIEDNTSGSGGGTTTGPETHEVPTPIDATPWDPSSWTEPRVMSPVRDWELIPGPGQTPWTDPSLRLQPAQPVSLLTPWEAPWIVRQPQTRIKPPTTTPPPPPPILLMLLAVGVGAAWYKFRPKAKPQPQPQSGGGGGDDGDDNGSNNDGTKDKDKEKPEPKAKPKEGQTKNVTRTITEGDRKNRCTCHVSIKVKAFTSDGKTELPKGTIQVIKN